MKLYFAVPDTGSPPLTVFLDALEHKLRLKILRQFTVLMSPPLPREPYVKHFSIERYSSLYELRARGKIMIRIIFTVLDDGSILFLTPFVKKHKRNTMQALNTSLKLLSDIRSGACTMRELTKKQIWEAI